MTRSSLNAGISTETKRVGSIGGGTARPAPEPVAQSERGHQQRAGNAQSAIATKNSHLIVQSNACDQQENPDIGAYGNKIGTRHAAASPRRAASPAKVEIGTKV